MLYFIIAVAAVFALICIVSFVFLAVSSIRRGKSGTHTDRVGPEWDVYRAGYKKCKEWLESIAPEPIEITSFDGLRLRGIFVPAENARGSVLFMHGYRSSGIGDFCCVLRFYHDCGLNIFLPDQRASGKSEGKYITFGVHESADCRKWVDFANEKVGKDLPLILDGMSMGASTVLMSADRDLPENVKGIIADCGFTSPWEILKHQLKSLYKLPPFPFLYTTDILSKIFAKYGFKQRSTLYSMKNNKIPTLFIHGKADNFVPTRMSVENYEVCASKKDILLVENAGHGLSYIVDKDACEKKLLEFFDECLAE